jgi:hypothetical protein
VLPAGEAAESATQAALVLSVPPPVEVSGRVELPPTVNTMLGTQFYAAAAALVPRCLDLEEDSRADCVFGVQGILQPALAEDVFRPRPVSTLLEPRGQFDILGVDCGACEAGAGAWFDLSVRPPADSHLPWWIRRTVPIGADLDLGQIRLPPAILHRGDVTLDAETRCSENPAACLPGALIRAFVLLDDRGEVIQRFVGLEPCETALRSDEPDRTCVRGVLEVAQARTAEDGRFELALPAWLD